MGFSYSHQVDRFEELVIELQVQGRSGGEFVVSAHAPAIERALKQVPRRLYVAEEDVRGFFSATASSSSRMQLKELGARLFTSLFEGELGSLREAARKHALSKDAGLQIRLRFRSPDSPLVAFPWETLFDTGRGEFVARLGSDAIARAVDMAPHASNEAQPSVLVASVQVGTMFSVDSEVEQLRSILSPTGVPLYHLENPSVDALRAETGYRRPTIFHYIGPSPDDWGSRSTAELLPMTKSLGRPLDPSNIRGASGVTVEQLLDMFEERPRLVCLNACRSAVFAARLACNVPAVVALNGDVADLDCVQLAATLFRRLAHGATVTAALAGSRQELSNLSGSNAWSAPVLYGSEGQAPLLGASRQEPISSHAAAKTSNSREDRKRELKRRALQRNCQELRQRAASLAAPPSELTTQLADLEAELRALDEPPEGASR
jgi:hypothetical protein